MLYFLFLAFFFFKFIVFARAERRRRRRRRRYRPTVFTDRRASVVLELGKSSRPVRRDEINSRYMNIGAHNNNAERYCSAPRFRFSRRIKKKKIKNSDFNRIASSDAILSGRFRDRNSSVHEGRLVRVPIWTKRDCR